ncbi:hypothetical protein AVEN_104117-1 [Araneus ventricosus]|uniref:Uncharacterized protein n=1 Tax=Araneus ventricosus TaxID=182803 RepID=A0A4Y2J9C7_ARAVE|nr:hypothetical protein AVEN_104117-1 [Araneus ventricosus]
MNTAFAFFLKTLLGAWKTPRRGERGVDIVWNLPPIRISGIKELSDVTSLLWSFDTRASFRVCGPRRTWARRRNPRQILHGKKLTKTEVNEN